MRVSSDTLQSLEFAVVRELLAERTVTPMGRPLALALGPLTAPDSIRAALDETGEAVRFLADEGGLPLRGILPVQEILEALRPEGAVLTALEVQAVVRFCSVVEDARGVRARVRDGYPRLSARVERLPELRAIVSAIHGKISASGDIEDSASAELGRIRTRIQSTKGTLHARLDAILQRAEADKVLRDAFVTERGGRFVIPVRSDSPTPVKGIVHGGSSSGATLFIEPLATVELNNDLVRLHEEETAEIERILRGWTERLRERLDELHGAADEMARLDLAQAKGLLARDLRAVLPALDEGGGGLSITGARHPLLERALAAVGARMVPIDVALPHGTSTLIVSGPNAGGKTVVLKTTGLLALMAHAGLYVPAEEARLPFLHQVLVDIGDRQSIEGSLSTFSAHIQNLAGFTRGLDPPALVLIDEIGTGTDPVEGGALAIALLEWLRRHGALTIATTHHGPVKIYGMETAGVASASVEFDLATLAPTYRLLQGIAGASSGLSIAARLGLDPEIVADAERRIDPEQREGERYLHRLRDLIGHLEEDRAELDRSRLRLEADARRAREEAIRSDHERAERFRGEMATALEEFRAKVRGHLQGVADKKEAIRLDKERALREADLRRDFERISREATPSDDLPSGGKERKGALRGGEAATPPKRRGVGPRAAASEKGGGGSEAPFRVEPGARVLVGPYGREGKVESVEGSQVTVLVGSARFHVRLDECLPPGAESGEPPLWKTVRARPLERELGKSEAPTEIHLIGLRVEEGIETLDKFLDDALLAGHREVRIVHGHGTGRLRHAVRELLARHPQVVSHRPGEPNEGGDGATIVRLEE